MLAYMDAVFVPEHDYASVQETDFAHLDLSFYRNARAALEAERFIYLEDCEDRTLTAAPGNVLMPVMIRVMTSSDGSIVAGIYHARIRTFWLRLLLGIKRKLPGRNVSLETEFEDGTFVSTNNSIPAQLVSLPPEIDCEYLPSGTPIVRLLERHRQRIAAKQAQTGLSVRCVSTSAEARAAQQRLDGLTAAYRRSVGGISKEELARFAGSHTALARELHIELRQSAPSSALAPAPTAEGQPTVATTGAVSPSTLPSPRRLPTMNS